MSDHYKTLGVAKNATPDEIKKAYRKLASQHHPDKGGDKNKFQEVQSAYDVLSDPQKRNEYDNPQVRFNNMNPNGFNFNMNMGGMNFDDIFTQFFNQQPRQQGRQVFRITVKLSLLDSYNGSSQIFKLQNQHGLQVVKLDIPKGIANNQSLRYDNLIEGASLMAHFVVEPDLKFDRQGNDLYANHSISVLDLITGGNFEFTTISNTKIKVNVKPKTQPFMQLRLPGHGMPIMNSDLYGDQLILLKPYIPDNIDDDIIQSILRSTQK
jgi:DnaJ-class molecular chaperone